MKSIEDSRFRTALPAIDYVHLFLRYDNNNRVSAVLVDYATILNISNKSYFSYNFTIEIVSITKHNQLPLLIIKIILIKGNLS